MVACRKSVSGGPNTAMIRVMLPYHLRTLAHVGAEVTFEIEGAATQRSVLDAVEARYPMLRGTIRDHVTGQRRPFLRFFACEQDLSLEPPETPLPDAVAAGAAPFFIIRDISGGVGVRRPTPYPARPRTPPLPLRGTR